MVTNQTRICCTLPDGRLCISEIVRLADKRFEFPELITQEDEADSFAYGAEKTLFELYRPWLENLAFSGEALEKWRSNVHFNEYVGDIPLTYREITTEDLPPTRLNRNTWRDDGFNIVEV